MVQNTQFTVKLTASAGGVMEDCLYEKLFPGPKKQQDDLDSICFLPVSLLAL